MSSGQPPNIVCCICYDDLRSMGEDDSITATPCAHAFYRNCLLRWFREGPRATSVPGGDVGGNCPICQSFILMNSCRQIYLTERNESATGSDTPQQIEENPRFRQELARVQGDLMETRKRLNNLRFWYYNHRTTRHAPAQGQDSRSGPIRMRLVVNGSSADVITAASTTTRNQAPVQASTVTRGPRHRFLTLFNSNMPRQTRSAFPAVMIQGHREPQQNSSAAAAGSSSAAASGVPAQHSAD